MLDPSIKPTGTLVAQPTLAAEQLVSLSASVKALVAAAAPVTTANTVQVSPGGQTFSTITDALNSITDASLQKQYLLTVGPGTYNEVVTCKPWVFVSGSGIDQTTVVANAGPHQWDKGTVRGCSNSAVQNMTIISNGQTWGDWPVAVNCDGAQNFDIENCALTANGVNGSNLVTLSVDYSSAGGGSQVRITYSNVVANGGGQPIGAVAFSNSYLQITESKIVAENANTAWGASCSGQSTMMLYATYVQGTESLTIPDYTSKITAQDCQLVGPYSPGVVIMP